MKRVILNLRTDRWTRLLGRASGTRLRVAAATYLLLCAGVMAMVGIRWLALDAAARAARSSSATADSTAGATARHIVAVEPLSAPKWAARTRIAQHLNFPWATVLNELERHASKDVAVLSIDPDAVQGRVRLELEARQLRSLIDFAQRLGSSPDFDRVAFGKHELAERDPAKPVRLSLEVKLTTANGRFVEGAR